MSKKSELLTLRQSVKTKESSFVCHASALPKGNNQILIIDRKCAYSVKTPLITSDGDSQQNTQKHETYMYKN